HHFVQRRRKDASRTETPRAKLLRASKPPHNSSASQQLRHLVDQPLFGLDVLIVELAVVEHCFDFFVGILRSEKRVLHFVFAIAVAKKVVPYIERGSDAASRVAAGRLNKNLFVARSPLDRRICKTVQRDAPGKTQILFSGLLAVKDRGFA